MRYQLPAPYIHSYKAFKALWIIVMLFYGVRSISLIGGQDIVDLPQLAEIVPQWGWVAGWAIIALLGFIGLKLPWLIHVASGLSVFLNTFIAILYIWDETRFDVLIALPYLLMAAATFFIALGIINSRTEAREEKHA